MEHCLAFHKYDLIPAEFIKPNVALNPTSIFLSGKEQNENSPFQPVSPYGVSKVFAHLTAKNYREIFNIHVSSGITFNHESERRDLEYVTRKITNSAAKIKLGLLDKIVLGDLSTSRDWGYAGDYVEAMWQMLQMENPDDYVIATGKLHSLRELLKITFTII